MKQNNRAKLLFAFLGIATFASLVGTVSGSLAWYAYSARASLSYSGTSVSNTVQLQIGIASEQKVFSVEQIRTVLAEDEKLTDEEKAAIENNFVEFWDVMEENTWVGDNNYYYFAPNGTGLTSSVINAYLKSNGFATNYLVPVTSGSYTRGDNFVLKKSPINGNEHPGAIASSEFYSKIPMVFRVLRSNTTQSDNYVEGSELWLVDAQVKASSSEDGNIFKGIRMFVDRGNDYNDDFILNPSAVNKGSNVVAGLLDLSRDHYYDYDKDGNEIIYGEYDRVGGIQRNYSGADDIVDINGTGKSGEDYDTFTARHRQGVNYYNNYNDCVFKTAEYESLSSIAPGKDEITGRLYNKDENHPTSVCKTAGAEGHYLGRVDFTIYLEGWDHSVIDEEISHYFDLGLTFEINKL